LGMAKGHIILNAECLAPYGIEGQQYKYFPFLRFMLSQKLDDEWSRLKLFVKISQHYLGSIAKFIYFIPFPEPPTDIMRQELRMVELELPQLLFFYGQ